MVALMLSGRIKARYSRAYSGGKMSTIVSFSTQTSMTWNGPRSQSKHCHPARSAIAFTVVASVDTLRAKCVDPYPRASFLTKQSPVGPTARLQLGPCGIDLHPGPVLVKLKRKEASRVGWKWYRGSVHEFGEHPSGLLRVSRGNRKVMDHGFLTRLSLARNSIAEKLADEPRTVDVANPCVPGRSVA